MSRHRSVTGAWFMVYYNVFLGMGRYIVVTKLMINLFVNRLRLVVKIFSYIHHKYFYIYNIL